MHRATPTGPITSRAPSTSVHSTCNRPMTASKYWLTSIRPRAMNVSSFILANPVLCIDWDNFFCKANRRNSNNNILEQFKGRIFEGQWFGVSLSSTGNGQFSACAHKYVHYYNFTRRDDHMSYGACYTFSNEFVQEYKVKAIFSQINK